MMGQEKSVPIRCHNICHDYSSAIKASGPLSQQPISINRQPSAQRTQEIAPPVARSPSHHLFQNTSISSKLSYKNSHTRSIRLSSALCTETTSSLYKAIDTTTKSYLSNQLHIKHYLGIADESNDPTNTSRYRPSKNGIRNYRPKILLDQSKPTFVEVSSTSSNESEDIDIWI